MFEGYQIYLLSLLIIALVAIAKGYRLIGIILLLNLILFKYFSTVSRDVEKNFIEYSIDDLVDRLQPGHVIHNYAKTSENMLEKKFNYLRFIFTYPFIHICTVVMYQGEKHVLNCHASSYFQNYSKPSQLGRPYERLFDNGTWSIFLQPLRDFLIVEREHGTCFRVIDSNYCISITEEDKEDIRTEKKFNVFYMNCCYFLGYLYMKKNIIPKGRLSPFRFLPNMMYSKFKENPVLYVKIK